MRLAFAFWLTVLINQQVCCLLYCFRCFFYVLLRWNLFSMLLVVGFVWTKMFTQKCWWIHRLHLLFISFSTHLFVLFPLSCRKLHFFHRRQCIISDTWIIQHICVNFGLIYMLSLCGDVFSFTEKWTAKRIMKSVQISLLSVVFSQPLVLITQFIHSTLNFWRSDWMWWNSIELQENK